MHFPNYNSGASEAAAVNNIANAGNFNFSSSQGSYMDALIYNTMTKTIVLAFNQYHVVSSIGPLGPSYYGSDGGIYFANSTSGYERNMGNPFEGGSNASGGGGFPEWASKTIGGFGLLTKGRELVEWEYLSQAKYNRALSGNFSQSVKHSLRAIKNTGRALGWAGIGVSAIDIGVNGINVSNSLDLIMGGVAFIPGVGWAISGAYFLTNIGTQLITNKSIGEHIQGQFTNPTTSYELW